MHGDDVLDLQELQGVGGLARAHGVVVADGQAGQVGLVELADDAHVAEDAGVARMVELEAVGEAHHVAHRVAAVEDAAFVQDPATVVGVHHGDREALHLLGAALVHLRQVLDAFRGQPVGGLRDADHLAGLVLAGQGHRVADVVEVAVGDEHDVDLLEALQIVGAGGVALHPGVDEHGLALGGVDLEGGVPQPGELQAAGVHRVSSLRDASAWG